MIYHSPINTLPISLLLSKALLIAKMISESAFNIKSAFDSKSAFRYHFWMKKCKVGAFGLPQALAAFVGAKDQAILAGPTSMRLQDGATLLMRAWPLPFAISTI